MYNKEDQPLENDVVNITYEVTSDHFVASEVYGHLVELEAGTTLISSWLKSEWKMFIFFSDSKSTADLLQTELLQ